MSMRIRCGTLFDGTSTTTRHDIEVLIDGATIADVRNYGAEIAEADINLSSCFVMPGFIDAHTHLSIVPSLGDQIGQLCQPAGRQALRVPGNIQRDLAVGTTTLRIMGEEDGLDVFTRQAIADGTLQGPHLLISGKGLAASNGHGHAKSAFDGVDELRKGARENLARGADFLKVFATGGVASGTGIASAMYTYDEMRVVVEEAERKDTYVAAHAHGGPGLRSAVEAGVRTIEHASLATESDIDLLGRHNCWVVVTLGILFHPDGIERGDGARPDILRSLREARLQVHDSVRRIFNSGLQIAIGTDSMHGGMAYEIQTAIALGLPAGEALRAATSRSAEALRIADRTGTIEAGKAADIIAFDGNPMVDPTALDRVAFVMKEGRTYRGGTR